MNVRRFGARGDGVGYDPAPGDNNRIQKAIDFCATYKTGGERGGNAQTTRLPVGYRNRDLRELRPSVR
jgi:polygalacturonase